MKIYLSENQRATLIVCLMERQRAIHKLAKEESWHPIVIAASLEPVREVMAKLRHRKPRGKR